MSRHNTYSCMSRCIAIAHRCSLRRMVSRALTGHAYLSCGGKSILREDTAEYNSVLHFIIT
jgi:hypothetical protein